MKDLSKFDYSSTKITNNRNRTDLTRWIVILGLIIITLLALIIIWQAKKKFEASQWVFNAIIPLIASWIGAVIAFYFGRENYEAATEQVLALTRDTLDDLQVKNIMINVKTIVVKRLDTNEYETTKLENLINLYKEIEKDRIPIFSPDGVSKYIIHRSTMSEYNSTTEKKDVNGKEIELNLKHIIDDNKDKFSHEKRYGFITVTKETSIQKALNEMNELEGCKDIFITDDGKSSGKVLGWLTDTLINRFLTV